MNETSKTTPNSGDKPRIVFFGNERIATGVTTSTPVLRMLLEEGYEVAAVVLHQTFGTSRKRRELEILGVASAHNIPVLYPHKLSAVHETLASYKAALGVLVAFGKIVPEDTINIFPLGIINVHPSLLPQHRGPTPLESVILAGETETAVSVMALAKEMDAGPVYAQALLSLNGTEAKQQLADTMLEISAEMLRAVLPKILDGGCVAAPQDHASATYDKLISKQDGKIDLSKTAQRLEREIRAYAGWPGSHTVIAGKTVTVTAAHVADNSLVNVDNKSTFVANKQLCLQTSEGILVIDSLKPAGKKDMPAAAFLAGYGARI